MVAAPTELEVAVDTGKASTSRSVPDWLRNLEIVIPAAILVLIVAACYLGPLFPGMPPAVGGRIDEANLPMGSPGHILGTGPIGNDILARLLEGGQVSIEISVSVILISNVIGGVLGAAAALAGGIVDGVIMRIMDTLIAFPALILVLVLAQALSPSELNVIWSLSVFGVPTTARVARASSLRVCAQDYMFAARLSGTSTWRRVSRHILPNVAPQLATLALLGMGIIVLIESTLSYLGFSVPLPEPTWGNMINTGQQFMQSNPSLIAIPSAVLFLYIVCLNLLSDALRSKWSAQ